MSIKQFPLLQVIEFYSSRTFQDRESFALFIAEMADVARHLMAGAVNLHDMSTMQELCRPYLLDQFPWLTAVDRYEFNLKLPKAQMKQEVAAFVVDLETAYGKLLSVESLPVDDRQPSAKDFNPLLILREINEILNSEDNDDGHLN